MGLHWVLPLLLISSCQYFQSKEERTAQLVQEKMEEIDMNAVDQYPLFENCDETASKDIQKDCFQRELMGHFANTIQELNFESEFNLSDTLWIDFNIGESGLLAISNVVHNKNVDKALPELTEVLVSQFNDSSIIAPALKRGIPVSMKVRLPVVIQSAN